MPVVLDANLVVALAVDDSRAPLVNALIAGWLESGEELHAPSLLFYEVASALTTLVSAGHFSRERLPGAWSAVLALPVTLHTLRQDGERVVSLAIRLRRKSAYDAAYVVLAEELNAELWTFDGPLARNASASGFPVRLLQ